MAKTTVRIAIVAVVAGLIGAYALRSLLTEKVADTPEPTPPVQISVPMASADLPTDRVVLLGDVALVPMTAEQMREQFGDELNELMTSPEQIIGRRLGKDLAKGRPFLTSDLYLEGTRPDLASKLEPGMVAVPLELPDNRGGALSKGAVVDVVFRSTPRAGSDSTLAIPETTITMIEQVKVLDVQRPQPRDPERRESVLDIRAGGAAASPNPTVTLAVTFEQAKMLKTVEGRGELTLVERRPDDMAPTSGEAQSLERLLGITAPPEPPRPFVTTISRRGSIQRNVFDPNSDSSAREW